MNGSIRAIIYGHLRAEGIKAESAEAWAGRLVVKIGPLVDRRVTELLEANNREVERRRSAEAGRERNRTLFLVQTEAMADFIIDLNRESMERFLADLMGFQASTFGPRQTLAGVLDHVTKEIEHEIRPDPTAALEWLGLLNLSVSALRIIGLTPAQAAKEWRRLLQDLKARDWPDWRTADPDKAIEHIRDEETQA